MTDTETWRAHDPVWSPDPDPTFPAERRMDGCTCGARPGPGFWGASWFGIHIEDLGAPDYMLTYWKHWTQVEAPTGKLDRDAVAQELSDFSFVMEQVSIVYNELADLSKPNYHAHAILGVINDRQEKHYREHYAERLCERADEVESTEVRDELVRLAEEWSPGAWAEYRQYRARVAELQAAKAS